MSPKYRVEGNQFSVTSAILSLNTENRVIANRPRHVLIAIRLRKAASIFVRTFKFRNQFIVVDPLLKGRNKG
jgi:hypothetical protein